VRKIIFTIVALSFGWFSAAAFAQSGAIFLYRADAAGESVETVVHTYYLRPDASLPPDIKARGYIVADLLTGDVLLQKNSQRAYPIASVSKLLTALVAIEQKLENQDLLYPLLLESSNVTADQIAKSFGTKTFISYINEKALKLGMSSTHFADPSGMSPRNVSSSADLLVLARDIYKNRPEILNITLLSTHGTWQNNNLFVQKHEDNYIGGKTGYTPEAKGALVSLFALPVAGQELRPLAIILLGTDSSRGVKYEVARSIIDYVLANVYYK